MIPLIKNNRQELNKPALTIIAFLLLKGTCPGQDVNNLKLKDYRPESIYNIPVTKVDRAKYPAIDMHTHVYGRNEQDIRDWIKAMDACGIEKAIVFTGASGARFDTLVKLYSKYSNRFELWCGFDYTGYDKPGFGPEAVKELERCVRNGARGVGEVMFKGKGVPPGSARPIMLPDDPRLDLLFEKCTGLPSGYSKRLMSIFTKACSAITGRCTDYI